MSVNWISTFLDAQAAELGAARNTLLAYGRDLKDIHGWLIGHGRSFEKRNSGGCRGLSDPLQRPRAFICHTRPAAIGGPTALSVCI